MDGRFWVSPNFQTGLFASIREILGRLCSCTARSGAGGDLRDAAAKRLESHYLLRAVLGELHWRLNQHRAAEGDFRRALHRAQVGPKQNYLTRMIERVEGAETANCNEPLRRAVAKQLCASMMEEPAERRGGGRERRVAE